MTFDEVRKLALALPEVEEGTSFGTPSFKVRKKLLARLRDDGETLAVKVDMLEREALLADGSGAYYITDHYREWPYVLVKLSVADPTELHELLVEAWLREAPKRLAAAHEEDLLGG